MVNSTQAGTQGYGYTTAGYTTLAAFQAGNPGMEVNGLSVNPQYTAPTTGNFTPMNPALIGAGANVLTLVPRDINGTIRSASPTIGAIEVLPTLADNAGILSTLSSPSANFCAGVQPLKVTVRNAGTNNITSMQVNWSLNSVVQTPFSFTGTLVPITTAGTNSAVVTVGNPNLIAGANVIKVWTSQPNSVADTDPTNDTLTTTITPATFTLTSTVDTVCTSGISVITLNPSTGYNVGDLEWQSSPNGTAWTSIPSSDSSLRTVSGLSATTYFRARLLNSSAGCVSPAKMIVVSNPTVVSTVAATRCGLGTVTLTGTPKHGRYPEMV